MANSREEQLQADLANTALFFLLLFLVGSSLYYSFSDNVGWRSALYILTSLVAIASYCINKTKMDDLTLVLDRKNNICRFLSGQNNGFRYSVCQKPFHKLRRASLVNKPVIKTVELAYGAVRKREMVASIIVLEFEDGDEIGWEYWDHQRPKFYLNHLTIKINRFIGNLNKQKLKLLFYDYKNYSIFLILVAIIFPILAIFHR